MKLDDDLCYRALQTHDVRFDGQFYTAVVTTGVYCRSTCPAPTPKRANVRFFRHAAAAHAAGFRPCLRCRPELAPDLFAALGPTGVVARALRLIAEGILDDGSVTALAGQLGVTERHLRRLCVEQLGASPTALAQNRRILFAKQLISETDLSFAEVALAAGFGSIRRFNDVLVATYARTPRQLRRTHAEASLARNPNAPIRLRLGFSPPYDWPAMLQTLAESAIPGVERVQNGRYARTIALDGAHGFIDIGMSPDARSLEAIIRFPKLALLGTVVERIRRLFDLHANIAVIEAQLTADLLIGPLIAQRPGVHVAGAWDSFEFAVRAILGQQLSGQAANALAQRIAATHGEPLALDAPPGVTTLFPEPLQLAHADLAALGLPQTRAAAINGLAAALVERPTLLTAYRDLDEVVARLMAIPGVGPWTAGYIAMRALREPDAFPAGDLGLRRALAQNAIAATPKALAAATEAWRPWRAYATVQLWQAQLVHGREER